jgi:hypothetical protein
MWLWSAGNPERPSSTNKPKLCIDILKAVFVMTEGNLRLSLRKLGKFFFSVSA